MFFKKNKSNKDRQMLVVRSRQAIRHAFIHQVPKMPNQMPNFKKELGKSWEKMAKTTRKEIADKISSK